MAPIEFEFGTYWNDGTADGFSNSKAKLPLIVARGRKVKKTYKEGKLKLELEIKCDKDDRGGSIAYKFKWNNPGDPPFTNWANQGAEVISLGGTAARVLQEERQPVVGFRARHVGEIADLIIREIQSSSK